MKQVYAVISCVCGSSIVVCMLSFSGWGVVFSPRQRRTQPNTQRMRIIGRRSGMSVRFRMRFPYCSKGFACGVIDFADFEFRSGVCLVVFLVVLS